MAEGSLFLSYLMQEFDRRKKANSKYSLRSYSLALGISSSLLSRIMKGKIPLTLKMVNRLNAHFKLPNEIFKRHLEDLKEKTEIKNTESIKEKQKKKKFQQFYLTLQEKHSNYDISLITVALDDDLLPEIDRKIYQFQHSLIHFVQTNSVSSNSIYELTISFLPKSLVTN